MRFPYPAFPAEFEIPDAWLDESGIRGWKPGAVAFLAEAPAAGATAAEVIGLADIAPPYRFISVPKDFRGFDHDRMVRVLRGFVQCVPLPPVDLIRIPKYDAFYAPYKFGLIDGVHRFFASLAAGHEAIPSTIREPFL